MRETSKVSAFFLTCLVLILVSPSIQSQTVTNGNFEGGFTNNVGNGWNSWIDTGWDTASFADGTDRYVSAYHSQKFNATQPNSNKTMGIYQQVNTAVNGTYTFYVSHYHTVTESYGCENMELYMALDPYGTFNKSALEVEWHQLSCTRNQWITQNYSVVAKATQVTIYLEVRRKWPQGGMGYAWFDNVSVSGPTPDPTYTPTVTVTATPTQPPPVGPELVTNGNMENFTSGLANGWSSWSTNGTGYWKQSSLVGKSGGGTYANPSGWYEDFVAMNAKTYLLGSGFGAADSLENESHLTDSIVIGRLTMQGHHEEQIYYGDYQAVAVWLANYYQMEAGYHPRVDAWLGQNEPDWTLNWQRAIDFEIYFTQQMHQRKLQTVVLNMAVGTPGDIQRILHCKDLFEICDYYGHHVYGGPADQLMVLPYVQQWNQEDPYLYALRCRQYEQMYRDRGWRFPPVIYTEGTTYGGWHSSWVTAAQVRDDLIAMIPFMNADRWNTGLCIFDNGGPGVWEEWDVTGHNICAPVGQANNADPADKTSGLYSQKFGVGDLHCKVGGCTRNGVFTGGIVQAVSGLTANETYLLEFDFKWAHANGASNMTFTYGLDWTGQTANGNAGTIAWSSDLISLYNLPHQIFKHHYDVFNADASTVSIWFKAYQNLSDVPIRVTVDSVSLRQVSGTVQATSTFTPTNTRTNTPTHTPTSQATQVTVDDYFTSAANFDANWTAFGTSPSRYIKSEWWCNHTANLVEIQSSNGGYRRTFTEGAAGGTYTLTMDTVRGNGARYIRVDSNGGTNPATYDKSWDSNGGSWNCENPSSIVGTVGGSGNITVFLGTNNNGQYEHLRIVFDPPSGPVDTPTNTATNTRTNTPTNTRTNTPTNTRTNTPTNTRTNTPTNTRTNTPTNTRTNTPTNTPTQFVITEAFTSMPSWSSSFNASWGSAATWSIVSGGQSGNCLRAVRASGGSSARVRVYSVPTNKSLTISIYMRCPSMSNYWMETAFKLGSYTAENFDQDAGSWTLIKKFDSYGGQNGNSNTWTQYSTSVNTGGNSQISIGYKLGSSGNGTSNVHWDTFRIQS